jgi:GH24 family phage-related lysozyme (muramidase)
MTAIDTRPVLRLRSRGEPVKRLQAALAGKGFSPGPADGDFGPKTERAVREFQRAKGLAVDGIVGPQTWAALLKAGPGAGGHRLSDLGVDFIARFEGFRGALYNDPAGHCTIGCGHLVHRGGCDGSELAEFRGGISRQRAAQLLRVDAGVAVAAVRDNVARPLTPQQFDALVSFTFNVGAAAFRRSTLLQRLNAGAYEAVPEELRRWVTAGGRTLPGLVARRAAEAKLFTSGRYQ